MPEIKPIVPEAVLHEVVKQYFGSSGNALKSIEGGLVAQAFSFSARGQDYILRFNTSKIDANFEKEAFIARHFRSPLVPIPAILAIGRVNDLSYCISEKASGTRLDQLSPQEIQQALPSVMETLDAIHVADVSERTGYGIFDNEGKGLFASWPASLTHVREEQEPDGFFGRWHELFETGFLERDVFERVYEQMQVLLEFCPKERYLVHGDYGFSNLLVARNQVTAVLDWINAGYGDLLYDVAWLDFWDPKRGYGELFQAHYAKQDLDMPDYERRLFCYRCYIALNSLRFFAKTNNVHAYQWVKERIQSFSSL